MKRETHNLALDDCERSSASFPVVVDVGALIAAGSGVERAVLWAASNQLQTNIVFLPPDESIPAHAEPELDVTMTVIDGSVELRYGADSRRVAMVQAPAVVVLPAGTRRSFTAGPHGATYLTAHRRRAGMLPTVR